MKVASIYTSATPGLVELAEKEAGDVLPRGTEVVSHQDPSILAEIKDAGYTTAPLTARLAGMYMIAVSEGVNATLNLCSSVGKVADAAQDIVRYTRVPIVHVGEGVCQKVARQRGRIRIIAALPTILNPTKNTTLRVTGETNHRVELIDTLVNDGFGLDQEQFKDLMSEYAETIADKVGVILFAQGPVAYCEEHIHEEYGKVTLSSPRFGAAVLRDALIRKGLM